MRRGRCIPALGADSSSLLTLRAGGKTGCARNTRSADAPQTNVSAIFERPVLPGLPRKWVSLSLFHYFKITATIDEVSCYKQKYLYKYAAEHINPLRSQ